MLDTAVAVGLMTRSAAQSVLLGEGNNERKPLHPGSRAPTGLLPPYSAGRHVPPMGKLAQAGARHARSRAEQQQSSARWHEIGSGLGHGVLNRENVSRNGGVKEGFRPPDVAQGDGYLSFYSCAPGNQDEQTNMVQEQWLDSKANLHPVMPELPVSNPQGADSQRLRAPYPTDQAHLHRAALAKDILGQHPSYPAVNESTFGGGKGFSVPLLYDRTIAPCPSLIEGLQQYCPKEGVALDVPELQCK